MCEGWGDPHYITFDGLYYSYQGNCTYVLAEEISPRHNLKIYIDNVHCDPVEEVSCPRSIIISYASQVITLINYNLIGIVELEVINFEKLTLMDQNMRGCSFLSLIVCFFSVGTSRWSPFEITLFQKWCKGLEFWP